MKRLILILGVVVTIGLQAQTKLTVDQTSQLEKKADSLSCAAHHLLIGCFDKWDDTNYNMAIGFLNQSKAIYERLMKEGTAETTELAELLGMMVESRISVIESKLMIFDDSFAKTMKSPADEKTKKKKYNGTEYSVLKSLEYKFDSLTATLSMFCD